ncbi:hypothetical protein ACQP25_20990 [Microtetraspora malaysiensis]|uniref:hypothetical protein n=1 Tax=Microtetraspora malaysiensis TaxID=161358 RepID=UPI003D8FC978
MTPRRAAAPVFVVPAVHERRVAVPVCVTALPWCSPSESAAALRRVAAPARRLPAVAAFFLDGLRADAVGPVTVPALPQEQLAKVVQYSADRA